MQWRIVRTDGNRRFLLPGDVYPDGRVEASDDERFGKADFYSPDYKHFAALYNSHNDYMMFLRQPVPLTQLGVVPVMGVKRLALMAVKSLLVGGLCRPAKPPSPLPTGGVSGGGGKPNTPEDAAVYRLNFNGRWRRLCGSQAGAWGRGILNFDAGFPVFDAGSPGPQGPLAALAGVQSLALLAIALHHHFKHFAVADGKGDLFGNVLEH